MARGITVINGFGILVACIVMISLVGLGKNRVDAREGPLLQLLKQVAQAPEAVQKEFLIKLLEAPAPVEEAIVAELKKEIAESPFAAEFEKAIAETPITFPMPKTI